MKLLLTTLFTLAAAPALWADVAIYSGSTVTKTTSAAGSGTSVSKMIAIIDLATGQSQNLVLAKPSGRVRSFSVQPALASSLTTVADSKNGKSSAVVSFASTTTDATTGVISTSSVLLQGRLNGGATVARQFHGVISLVASAGINPTGGAAIPSELVIATPVLNLDAKLSKAAKDAGHLTVDAALADVKAALIASGLTEKP